MLIAYIKTANDSTPEFYLLKNKRHLEAILQEEPQAQAVNVLNLIITGKTYTERKAQAENIAQTWQALGTEYNGGNISQGELAEVHGELENIAKKYGLVKDFKENAII